MLLVTNNLLKAMWKKRNKYRKIVLLTRNKLNNIERIIFKTLTDGDISHEEFTIVSDEIEDYRRPVKDATLKGDRFIEHGKRIKRLIIM